MSDKIKTFASPTSKSIGSKYPSSVSVPRTSRKVPEAIKKGKTAASSATSRYSIQVPNQDAVSKDSIPKFDAEYRQIAYGKFLRSMLEECLLDEKIEREETLVDIQMTQLAERFVKTTKQLDNTSRRLKEINFVVEQKRLLDLKKSECEEFYTATEKSKASDLLDKFQQSERMCLDKLHTKNVDFGFDLKSGHKQLLDAVDDAIEGLEQIKKHSNLDMNKFKEYEKTQQSIQCLEKKRFDMESLKVEFEAKFPMVSEKLLKDVSEQIGKLIDTDEDE